MQPESSLLVNKTPGALRAPGSSTVHSFLILFPINTQVFQMAPFLHVNVPNPSTCFSVNAVFLISYLFLMNFAH
jgi:hypothetical protein